MEPSHPKFCHPYEPYEIQLQLMEAIYKCIERGQIGIFESPTGTGKSLSLICASLTWLRDNERRSLNEAVESKLEDSDDPPWMIEAAAAERRQKFLQARRELDAEISVLLAKSERQRRHQSLQSQPKKRQKLAHHDSSSLADGDEQYALEDYESDDDLSMSGKGIRRDNDGLSATTASLLGRLSTPSTFQVEEKGPIQTRIFYCSRTHSQLSQFVSELRRVKLPSSLIIDNEHDISTKDVAELLKHISLGSRKNLCINKTVSKLSSTTLINERCRELQKPGMPTEHRCKYLPAKDETERWNNFRTHALGKIRDIEDLEVLGRQLEVCPYYASRLTVSSSEIVTMPYPLLLQRSARETLKLDLKDQVIIIDEAHNLIDAISNANSTTVSLSQVNRSIAGLTSYVQTYRNRLKGKNRVYVAQIIRLLHSVAKCAAEKLQSAPIAEQIILVSELMAGKGVDQINTHKLSVYLQESKLALKVEGFTRTRKDREQNTKNKDETMHLDDLTSSQAFLLSMMNPSAEGVIYLSSGELGPILRYSLLDPKNHFRDIVEDARAIILVGGTMTPMSDYANYLFPYLPSERIVMSSFGHVIPSSNLLALSMDRGSSGVEFDFTFEKRKSNTMMLEIGTTLIELCKSVPDGVVTFFPSYDYLKLVVACWQQGSGMEPNTLHQLQTTKPVFWEDKTQNTTDSVFELYAKSIDEGKGGILLSVVGGKLSEGINFSDRLGRAVVVVGLPFPNINSAEWKAKIKHVEETFLEQSLDSVGLSKTDREHQARAAGRDFYENACMRAVNQCIGRAIRHVNDYASIILLDRRYKTSRIRNKLPGWIRQSMTTKQENWSFAECLMGLKAFFEDKK